MGRAGLRRGADLVLFPEMALTGYPVEDLALRQSFVEDVADLDRPGSPADFMAAASATWWRSSAILTRPTTS